MPSKKFKIVHRIPNSNILIDYWRPVTQDKYYRFMTYLRIGADASSIKDICESTYTIYTSLFNKWYLITYYQVSEHRIIELRENETLTVLDDQSNPSFSVTAFDANYYTGSLMFLFQGSFGNILYTGFFRPSSFDSIFESPILKSLVEKRELDVAYVDNTYAAEHCEFPSRSEILDQIVTCLRQHPKHKIAISGKRLGKEEILLDIAKALDEKIHVSEEKFVILSRLNLQNHFTTDRKKSRIIACDYIINPKECMNMQAQEGPYIIILLTAFYHCNRMCHSEELNVPGLHIFPYSGHCSHSELVRFISFLKPRDVQPIIKFMKDEHSIIPQCIFKLCHKPHSFESQTQASLLDSQGFYSCRSEHAEKFYTCEAGNSQSTSTNTTTMITVYDPAQKQEMIDNAINELKSFNDVDDFLDSVSDINNESNFDENVSECIVAVNTMEVSGNLDESLLNNLLSNSGNSNETVSFTNSKVSAGCSKQLDIIQSTDSSSLSASTSVQNVGETAHLNDVTVAPENQIDFPHLKTMRTKTLFKTIDSITSTSYTVVNENEREIPKKISNTPKNQEYSTNTYAVNDIAENVISSTNNETLPAVASSSVREPVEKIQATSSTSVTVGDVNIDIRSDLDLQDMTDKDDPPEVPCISNEPHVEEQPPKLFDNVKKFEEKSVQTDLTLKTIMQLEKFNKPGTSRGEVELSVAHDEVQSFENREVAQLIAKYVSTNKRSVFDMNSYFGKSCKKRGQELCTSPLCKECRTHEENIKKRKLIRNTLYNSAKSMSNNVLSNNTEFCKSLVGYNLCHPMYKNSLNL